VVRYMDGWDIGRSDCDGVELSPGMGLFMCRVLGFEPGDTRTMVGLRNGDDEDVCMP
jgi:hypothetical protein